MARPLELGNNLFGALVVAKPNTQLHSRSVTLIERLGIAFGGGVIVAGLLGLYLSRRLVSPLRKLSKAADEVAAGHYGVELPEPRGGDEIAHLSSRFSDMAAKLAESEQLSRNFLMSAMMASSMGETSGTLFAPEDRTEPPIQAPKRGFSLMPIPSR